MMQRADTCLNASERKERFLHICVVLALVCTFLFTVFCFHLFVECTRLAPQISGGYLERFDAAFRCLLAAGCGDVEAQARLGELYAKGKNYNFRPYEEKSLAWYRKAAEQGHAGAQFAVGEACRNGSGTELDRVAAAGWYRKAAEQGHAEAQYRLALMYHDGNDIPRDKDEALRWYRKAAEQGHAEAQYRLALMYHDGDGVPRDKAEVIRLFRMAAEGGDAEALWRLGKMYEKGDGLPQDREKALRFFQNAASRLHGGAQFALGMAYALGDGLPQSDRWALYWINAALEMRRALQHTYFADIEDARLRAEMVSWVRRMAELGYASAQVILGSMYACGDGVPQDKNEAVLWLRKARDQTRDGLADDRARALLAASALEGYVLPQDKAGQQPGGTSGPGPGWLPSAAPELPFLPDDPDVPDPPEFPDIPEGAYFLGRLPPES